VEIDMSKSLCINTPLPITVGKKQYTLITFEDLYRLCLKDRSLFPEMIKEPREIGLVLERRELVLAAQCLRALIKRLNDPKMLAVAKQLLSSRTPWPVRKVLFWGNTKSMKAGDECYWPDCPSD
jgi:hypothetical protein